MVLRIGPLSSENLEKMRTDPAIEYIIDRLRHELPADLRYHCLEHTLHVIDAAKVIAEAENLEDDMLDLLITAAAYHDCGFLVTYQKHEEAGCSIAENVLPQYGFSMAQIKVITDLIMATKVPQKPVTKAEKILCDADLDYLGGDNYEEIANGLFEELLLHGFAITEENWQQIQINFLEAHHYWTNYSQSNKAPKKAEVLLWLRGNNRTKS